MRSLRGTLMALVACLATLGLAGLAEVSCGDNSSATPIKSGLDATSDGEVWTDSAPQNDGGMLDAPRDSRVDVAADALPPGLVAAITEATAQCTSWLTCCPGGLDGGNYDLQHCIDNIGAFGWEGTLPRDNRVYFRGHIVVDQSKAAGCISALNSFPCGAQTAAQWGAITTACELVIQGTIASNSPGCISSFECAPGNYCDPTVDGGLCTPLATQGQPCNTKINDPAGVNPLADEMCSYLSSGQPPLFCDMINSPPDAATCQPLLMNGATCSNPTTGYYDDQACSRPALCGDNLQCNGTASYPYANFCEYYRIQDAGGPG